MKLAKYLSLSLVLFTLLGCNNPPQATQIDNQVEAANNSQKENLTAKTVATNKEKTAISKKQDLPVKTTAKEVEKKTTTASPQVVAQTKDEKIENGRLIGGRFDCNGDGISDGVRIDYDDDGIPDDCIGEDEKDEIIIDETSYKTVGKSLEQLTQGCKETKKTQGYIDYTICKKGETLVSASEYAPEADAGLVYWFAPDGRVVAARYLNSGMLYIFGSNGKITSKFNVYESKKFDSISAEERKDEEKNLLNAYQDILKVF